LRRSRTTGVTMTFAAFLMMSTTVIPVQAVERGYHVVNHLNLPGPVRWDYITSDDATGRLFIAREQEVDVVDSVTGHLLGTIPLGLVHGIALDEARHQGFISDEASHDLAVFDTTTLAIIAKVAVGEGPDAVVYDRVADTVFAIDRDSRDVTPILAASGRALAAIPLPDEPEFAVADGSGRLFINLTNKAEVAVIDTATRKLTQTWPLGPACVQATGLAIDRDGHRLFAACRNGVVQILSSEDGHAVASVPVGKFSDATVFDQATKTAFSSSGTGTLSVIAQDAAGAYAVRQTVTTPVGARTMAIDAKTHRLYLPSGVVDHVDPPAGARPYPLTVMKAGSFNVLVVAP